MSSNSTRVQIFLSGKTAELWELIPTAKKKAFEQAIICLAKDENLAPVFFSNLEKVRELISQTNTLSGEKNIIEEDGPKDKTVAKNKTVKSLWEKN